MLWHPELSEKEKSIASIQAILSDDLAGIDFNNYILNSIIAHLRDECEDHEVIQINDEISELESGCEDRGDFVDQYATIFDLVDFPVASAFEAMDKKRSYSQF